VGFSPRGMLFGLFPLHSPFFRSLFRHWHVSQSENLNEIQV